MKFKNNVLGVGGTGIGDPVRSAGRIKHNTMRRRAPSQGFDLSLQDDEDHIIRVNVRRITGAGLEDGRVGMEFP